MLLSNHLRRGFYIFFINVRKAANRFFVLDRFRLVRPAICRMKIWERMRRWLGRQANFIVSFYCTIFNTKIICINIYNLLICLKCQLFNSFSFPSWFAICRQQSSLYYGAQSHFHIYTNTPEIVQFPLDFTKKKKKTFLWNAENMYVFEISININKEI